MTAPVWITPAGDLGIIPEQEYYEFHFDSYNPGGGLLTYRVIAGNLPAGLEIKNNGLVLGIPTPGHSEIAGVPAEVTKVTVSTFTIRVTNNESLVADRTFSLTVAGILPQEIIPVSTSLGAYVDGSYVEVDLNTVEPNSLLTSTFRIVGGELPPGLFLNPITGVISGYVYPLDTQQTATNTGFDNAAFDLYGFAFSGTDTSKNFQFTVEADNGITIETKTYTIYIIAISNLTADNDILTADNVSLITADSSGPYHLPYILNESGSLGNVRQNTRVDIKIYGEDFDGDQISYILDSGALPDGLSLNTTNGWITGIVPYGTLGNSTYTFTVKVYKTDLPDYQSTPKTFTLKVLGQIADTVTWLVSPDLGTLYTGEISELFVRAVTESGRSLSYRLVDSAGRLPAGIELLQNGLLSGRASFETFMLDSGSTTFDQSKTTYGTTFDQTYSFTIAAYDAGNFVYDTRTFTVSITKRDIKPYENLYIQALPNKEQRQYYDSIVNNEDLIPIDYLYRPGDPWFGKNLLRRSLFMTGLDPDQAATYIASMTYNHYWKTLNFGQIKTAQALDNNFNVKYEVVYVELIDRQVNSDGVGPNLAVSLPTNSANISTIYPNSFPNMVSRVATGVGYENRSILPDWMSSRQQDGTVLGFTRALVLCYTVPGKSKEIAYRVTQVQDTFKYIDFTVDRYDWDNSLSRSYNKQSNIFVVNNFVSGIGTINSNVYSNIITGLTLTVNGSGTISGTYGSAMISGNGTAFGSELRIGKPIYRADDGNVIGVITSIKSATSLVLDNPLTTSISSIAYSAETSATAFETDIHVGDTIIVNSNVRLGTVKSINSNSNITLYSNAAATYSNVAFEHNARDPYEAPGQGDKYLKFPQVGVIT